MRIVIIIILNFLLVFAIEFFCERTIQYFDAKQFEKASKDFANLFILLLLENSLFKELYVYIKDLIKRALSQ